MNYQDNSDNERIGTEGSRGTRLALVLGVAGAALGAAAFGFVVVSALGGGSDTPAGDGEPQGTPEPTVQPTGSPSGRTEPTATPSPTPVPPTATPSPIPPTPTPTVPPIVSPKFHDIFRAEGGSVSKNKSSQLPFRRLEAQWDNSYKGCPGSGCVRGRVSVMTGIGPLGTGESLTASAQVYNTFIAQRAEANLLMDLRWKGNLAAVVAANTNTGVEIEVVVREVNRETGKAVKALPGMPYSVLSEELGLEAIQGVDTLDIKGSRSINIPLKLETGHMYRIDLNITCATRAAFSLSATTCSFWGDDLGAEWTKQVIEYDKGICPPARKGEGCIYQ